jgi:hypothetical protein
VQAQIARKPVITYLPISEVDELSPGLPNLIGEKCATLSAVLEALERNTAAADPEALSRTIAKPEAIQRIVGMIEEECTPPVGRDALDEIVVQVTKVARRGKSNDARKRLRAQVFSMGRKVNKNKGKKFDAAFFGRAGEVCLAAQNHLKCEVELLMPHSECLLLVPRSSN